MLTGRAAGAGPTGAIDTITFERGCSGCSEAWRLVLRRDGRAELTRPGNARLDAAEQASSAQISPQDFEQLAQLLQARGFFGLAAEYADPQLQDGPWATLTVMRGGQTKQVFRRDDAGPPALKVMEAAIDSLRSRLQFSPATPR